MAKKDSSPEPGGIIPIFPLPSTVFFPETHLPLHIFEPRYRQMVAEALEGNKRIGMILLKPGWEDDYYGNPAVVSIGCVGIIERHTRLEDGKYNIVLKGTSRYRILKEIGGKLYRRAEIELLPEVNDGPLGPGNAPPQDSLIRHYQEFTRQLPRGELKNEPDWSTCHRLSELVDRMAYLFDLSVEQKQSFLEEADVVRRVDFVHGILKMKLDLIHRSKTQTQKGTDVRMN